MHRAHGIRPGGLKNENMPNERHKDHYMYEYGKRNVTVHWPLLITEVNSTLTSTYYRGQ